MVGISFCAPRYSTVPGAPDLQKPLRFWPRRPRRFHCARATGDRSETAPAGKLRFAAARRPAMARAKQGLPQKSEAATGFRSRPAVRGLCFCVKCSCRVLQQTCYPEKAPWGAAHFFSGAPSRHGAGKKKPPAKRGSEIPDGNPLSPPGGLPQARPRPQRCGRRGRAAPPAAARKRPPAPPR